MAGSYLYQVFVVVCLVLVRFADGDTTYASGGENKVMKWTITPQPGDTLVRILHPSDEILYLVLGRNVLPGTGSNKDRVTNTGNTNTNTGHIEFTLNDVRVTDAGDYKTDYQPPGYPLIVRLGVTMIVYAMPSTPVLTIVTAPVVGQDMVLKCTASSNSKPDGKLTMHYTWYLNNTDLPSDSRYATTGSLLQIKNIQKSDKYSTFTCRGYENTTLLSEASDGYSPDIKHGPDGVKFSPDIARYDKNENENIGTITCSADCNPLCAYQWKFNGRNVGGQSNTLTLNSIQRGQAGSYWCTASNEYGSQDSQRIIITIIYRPGAVALSPNTLNYAIVEVTQNIVGPITCYADCNPPCTYQWSRDGTVVRSTAVLELNGATRADDGTYICTAKNSYGDKDSAQVRMTVEYKPENIRVIPNSQLYVLLESDRLGPVVCSSTCNPECAYKWQRDGVDIGSGAVLDMSSIQRTQEGKFTCVASNSHGVIKSGDITVVVEYPPDLTIINTNVRTGVIHENDTLIVICATDSVPSSVMKLWFEGDGQRIVDMNSSGLKVNYTKRAECMDSGVYFCDARNKFGNSTSKKTSITVLCSPRPSTGFETIHYVIIGDKENLNFTGSVVAHPQPLISWTFRRYGTNNSNTLRNETDDVEIYKSQSHMTYSSRFIKRNVRVADIGDYVMNASNIYGSVLLIFHVSSIHEPDPPYNISIGCDTTEAQIDWTSNFNGGASQHFVINVKKANRVHETYTVADKGAGQRHGLTVTNLDPDMKYSLVVNARNLIGDSINPSTLFCTTRKTCIGPLEDQPMFKAAISMIVISVLCLGVSLLLTLYSFRRIRSNEQKTARFRNQNDGSFERENDAYSELDLSRTNTYEDLGEKDKPSVYDKLKTESQTDKTHYVNSQLD